MNRVFIALGGLALIGWIDYLFTREFDGLPVGLFFLLSLFSVVGVVANSLNGGSRSSNDEPPRKSYDR